MVQAMIKIFPDVESSPQKEAAMPPGSIIYVGEEKTHGITICYTQYSGETVKHSEGITVDEFTALKNSELQGWIDVNGVHHAKLIEDLGRRLSLDSLILEDVVNTRQRPKLEEYDDCLFIVLKMIYLSPQSNEIISEHISLVLLNHSLVSFQEVPGDVFDAIRKRLDDGKTRLRNRKADYLLYRVIDAIVDNYMIVLDHIGDHIDRIEADLITQSGPELSQEIHELKRTLIQLAKVSRSAREVISQLERREPGLIEEETFRYIRDVYDHILQVSETIDSYRELVSGLQENYESIANNRANEIMKVLTIFASIFLPLTFFAGIYGMNFEHMPELAWKYGYFTLLSIMLLTAVGMVAFFKKKKWF